MFALFGASFFVSGTFIAQCARRVRSGPTPTQGDALLGGMVAAALFSSCTSRLHLGGHVNVMMFMTTFAAIAFGVTAARATADSSRPALGGILAALVSFQLIHFLYDPTALVPDDSRMRDASALAARVSAVESTGEVVISGRGHLTEPRHFHIMALLDLVRSGIPVPADLARALSERTYAAYVIDEPSELYPVVSPGANRTELFELVARNYFVAERWDDRPPVVGWFGRPSWVFRPRKRPLPTLPLEQLERLNRLEMALAELHQRAKREGAPVEAQLLDIESAAALDSTR
jgi:hypothetical protein